MVKSPSDFLLLFTFSATVGLGGVGAAFFVVSGFAAVLVGVVCEKPQTHPNIPAAIKSSAFFACIIL
jgi:hypothetical membrane protein